MTRTLSIVTCAALGFLGCSKKDSDIASGVGSGTQAQATQTKPTAAAEESVNIKYLELVTPDVESVCATYSKLYDVQFSEPVAELGNARTAEMPNGARVGVRGPLRPDEEPVVRPYVLVDDVAASVEAARAAGAEIAHPPMEVPGQGIFAIYILGGIEHGLWQR